MALNVTFLFYFLCFLVAALWVGYLLTRVLLGPQAAREGLYHSMPWVALGAVVAIALPFWGGYALTVLYGLYSLLILIWLVSWPLRKRQAGRLLHSVGATSQNKVLFWVGLAMAGLAVAMTLANVDQLTGALATMSGRIAAVVEILFWWAIALLFIFLSRSQLEIRSSGLSYLYAWQPWERVEAFGWDDDKPNTLILKNVPRFFFSRRYTTLNIPSAQKETVDQTIDDYLVEADLATEMDEAALD